MTLATIAVDVTHSCGGGLAGLGALEGLACRQAIQVIQEGGGDAIL
jgi:hypothetical protein